MLFIKDIRSSFTLCQKPGSLFTFLYNSQYLDRFKFEYIRIRPSSVTELLRNLDIKLKNLLVLMESPHSFCRVAEEIAIPLSINYWISSDIMEEV